MGYKLTFYIALAACIATSGSALALSPSEIYAAVSDSIVVVSAYRGDEGSRSGSGVLVGSGEVLTNCHILEDANRYKVSKGNALARGTLLYRDVENDLCLLVAPAVHGKPVQIGKASALTIGSKVYAIGSPKGLELSLSDGLVAQLHGAKESPLIQTTTPISKGSSGGGLFDDQGRLVGITTFYIKNAQNLNFAAPIELLRQLRQEKYLVEIDLGSAGDAAAPAAAPADAAAPAAAPADAAAPAAAPAALVDLPEVAPPGMDLVFSDGWRAVYIHRPTIRSIDGGHLLAWVLINRRYPTDVNAYSSQHLRAHDCAGSRIATLSQIDFSDHNGRGIQVGYEGHQIGTIGALWQFVAPNTEEAEILSAVCDSVG